MIYVTHDQVEAMTLGERIVVMDAGVVQQIDEPLAVYRQPANRFVAAFIGNPPMNFLAGELNGAGALRHGGGQVDLGAKAPSGRVLLGFRPHDVLLDGDGPPLGAAVLEVGRAAGTRVDRLLPTGRRRCAVRLPADSGLTPGSAIEPRLRRGAWSLFADDASARRIKLPES